MLNIDPIDQGVVPTPKMGPQKGRQPLLLISPIFSLTDCITLTVQQDTTGDNLEQP